jgi:uncharacterized Zn finger protein (UPF0148 family)
MGHVIELRRAGGLREPAPNALVRCARCGANLWNLLADGRVRCADCEEECPLRTVPVSGTAGGQDYEMNKRE